MLADATHCRLSRTLRPDRPASDAQHGSERRGEVAVVVLGVYAIAAAVAFPDAGEHQGFGPPGDAELRPVPQHVVPRFEQRLIRAYRRRLAVDLEDPARLAFRRITADLVDVRAEVRVGHVVVELAEEARRRKRIERVLGQRVRSWRGHIDERCGRPEDRPRLAFDPDVDAHGKCRGHDEERGDQNRHDGERSVKHESSFREGFGFADGGGLLTRGALPHRLPSPWASGMWRGSVSPYSGGTVPDLHRIPLPLAGCEAETSIGSRWPGRASSRSGCRSSSGPR